MSKKEMLLKKNTRQRICRDGITKRLKKGEAEGKSWMKIIHRQRINRKKIIQPATTTTKRKRVFKGGERE
jgi:hypothetical protein